MASAMDLIKQASTGAAAPQSLTSETLAPDEVAMRRKFCDWLRLWRRCTTPACRRAHRCAGDPTPCFAQFWIGCPEARGWVMTGIHAVEEGRSAREAARAADMTVLWCLKGTAGLPLDRRDWRRGRAKAAGRLNDAGRCGAACR